MSAIISAEENEQRMQLYSMGLSDAEIGQIMYLEYNALFNWRKRRGLRKNGFRGKVSLEAYQAVQRMAEHDEKFKEVLHAIKPNVEDIKSHQAE